MVLLILAGVLGLAALGLIGYVVYVNMAGRSKEESTESYSAQEHVEEIREDVTQEPALAKPPDGSEALTAELSSLKSIHRALQSEFENYKKNNIDSQEEVEKLKQALATPPPPPEDSAEVARLRSELSVFEKLVGEKNVALEKALKETANWQAKFKETLAANEASAQEIAAINTKLKDALAAKELFTKEKEEFSKKIASVQSLAQEVDGLKKQLAQKDDEMAQRIAAAQAVSVDTIKALEGETQKSKAEVQVLKDALAAQEKIPHVDPIEVETLKKNLADKDSMIEQMKAKVKTLHDACEQAQNAPKVDPSELEAVRAQLADKDAVLAKLTIQLEEASKQKGVSPEEYNKLKAKLEAAEKVLRVVHGAV